MRLKVLSCSLLFIITAWYSTAQAWRTTPYEIYAGIGPASYFGDIGGSADENNWFGIKDLDLLRSRPGFLAGLRYNHLRQLSFNGSIALGWLSGDDAGGRNESRGYVFNTVFLETSGRVEYYPIRDLRFLSGYDRRGMVRNYGTLSVYLFGGVGAVVYHVMPNDNLKARQERDNIEHGMVTVVLPAGAGVKLGISPSMDLGFEIGGRYALNDYLDGFTSPTATSNDIYYMTTIQLAYRLTSLGF